MMSDPEMMEVLQAMLGGFGEKEDDYNPPSFSSPPPSSFKPSPTPEPIRTEPLTEEEQRKQDALAAKERGNALYKAKSFDQAISSYEEAIALDPTNITFLNNKAAVLIEKSEFDAALELCAQALEIGKTTRASYDDKAKVYQRMAAAYLKKDDIKSAIGAYEKSQMEKYDKAIERKMKNLELDLRKMEREKYINPELALEAKERGNTAFREGNFPQAITEYEEAVKRDPTNAAYHNNLAAAFFENGALQ